MLTILAAMVWLAGLAPGQPPSAAKKTAATATVSKAPVKKSVAKGAPAAHTAAAATTSRAQSKSGARSKKQVVVRRPTQQQPTAERYKEIQQALADKGHFRGAVDGNWGPESVEALKNFQREQNLDSDGKIGALSLMALGLGPKRGIASAQNTPTKGSPSAAEPVDPPPVAVPQP